MRHLALLLSLTLATPALAQEAPGFFERLFGSDEAATDTQQGSMLEELIEDQLSGAGRVVEVEGFEGALSGAATLERLTIADGDGIWFTLEDAELDWSRAALFGGRIEVSKLTAATILLPRVPPPATGDAPTPEAQAFQLPELPVSIEIGEISAARVVLGAPILGEPVELQTLGALSLADGKGAAKLTITRRDAPGDAKLDAAYSNETEVLALDLALTEGPGGLLANLADLPGRPALDFALKGDAPISDFMADLRLATDGADRITGQIGTFKVDDTFGLTARLTGDVAPLFAPDYRPFFGDNVSLALSAFQTDGGATVLKDLSLEARALRLDGTVTLAPDGLPRRFDLTGEISDDGGAPVLLPLSGTETRIDRALLDLQFDARQGDAWQGRFDITGFEQNGITADRARLDITGQIQPGATNRVTADLSARIDALDPGDPAVRTAIGPQMIASATLDWQEGRDLNLSQFTLAGESYGLAGTTRIDWNAGALDITGQADLSAADLSRFSGLAGADLGGAAELILSYRIAPLARSFDVTARGSGQDIAIGNPRADAVLKGPATLDLSAQRDAGGITLALNSIATEQANLRGGATLTSGGSSARLAGQLADAGLLLDKLKGPVTLQLDATEDASRHWDVTGRIRGRTLDLGATARLEDLYDVPSATGTLSARIDDLRPLSDLAGRPIAGRIEGEANGAIRFDLSSYALEAELTGSALKSGSAELDLLLRGETAATLKAEGGNGRTRIERLSLTTGALTATTSGVLEKGASALDLTARLFEISPFVAGLTGAVEAEGTLTEIDGDRLRVDLTGTGPGGIRADVAGTISEDAQIADLSLRGSAPLALANRFIAPTTLSGPLTYDLRLNGAPGLGALSGQITSRGARLVVPEAGVALSNLTSEITLGGGRADLAISGGFETGGRLDLTGPVTLTAPFPGDLTVTLTDAQLTDPRLFATSLGGALSITGPLQNGAAIRGALTLGPTEIRIPSTGLGGAGDIPQITHINEPPPARGTRKRAGLLEQARGTGRSSAGPAYPLDVTISAPNRLFVRGRGLDSEFGGALKLGGTTRDVVPSGGFDLIRGRLDILGRRLDISEAQITMEGSFIPRLGIIASTEVDDTEVMIGVTGPADNPDIAFTSNPDLPQEEVLARLIFGRGLQNLSALQAARLALAVRTLAGRGGEGIVSRVRGVAGLADFDVTTTEDGNAAVRAGAYISENIYTDVTVDSEGETRLNLNLDLTPSLTVKGGTASDGESSIGIFFERDY
ncbi:MAG: translocation/assembly module TamB domain-containing protein [Silicimonas sp.]|nr:translocation/assembly module TamB domain-containing protein [Silicimonas sp.]